MKPTQKRGEKPGTSELYGKLSHATLWILFTFITLISYAAEVRPFINSSFGTYPLGLLDGILITIFFVAVLFYFWSKLTS